MFHYAAASALLRCMRRLQYSFFQVQARLPIYQTFVGCAPCTAIGSYPPLFFLLSAME